MAYDDAGRGAHKQARFLQAEGGKIEAKHDIATKGDGKTHLDTIGAFCCLRQKGALILKSLYNCQGMEFGDVDRALGGYSGLFRFLGWR